MALSPSIPTSFVPKQPVSPGGSRRQSSGNNIFLMISLIILAVSLVMAAGVFLYSTYLGSVAKQKSAQLSVSENDANTSTVEQFVRLRDRLAAAKTVMDQHIELSQFFTVLESITLQDVQFTTMKIEVSDDRSAKIDMAGTAKTFNALAAESTAFAAQKDIKSAIFSNISVGKDGTVSFSLDADLDPSFVIEAAAPATPALLPATTTAPTTISLPATQTATSTAPAISASPVSSTSAAITSKP